MGTIFFMSDSDKWGQGLKWGQSESGDNLTYHRSPDPTKNSEFHVPNFAIKAE